MGMIFALAVTAVPATAQDALICRKRDKQGEKTGQVTHLKGNGVNYNAGDGNDTVYGTPGDDIIDGGRGNDKVYGLGGNDIVCGGLNNDKVFGGKGNDEVYGEEDNDYLVGGPGNDYMLGAAGLDRLIGYGKSHGVYTDDGVDFMEGSYLSDVLVAGGFDTMYGGADDDVLYSKTPTSGAERMDGGLNNDTITGSDAADKLLYGDTGDDTIHGGGGDDTIRGGNNDDTLFGDDGNDQLFGELGKDILSGGNDTDVCDGDEQDDRADDSCEQKVDIP
jgi:Ca2+-binding RTX toxin-like protein